MHISRRSFLKYSLLSTTILGSNIALSKAETETLKPWSIAVIPDTQYYVRNENDYKIFTEITQWLVDQKDNLNLQLVLHVGDIVDSNNDTQWSHAKESLKVLDGKLPYVLSVGNHDLGRNASDRSTMLNQYVKISDNPLNEKIYGGCFEEGHLENAWYKFKYGNRDFIIFSLEFGPRDEVLAWANKVADMHSDKSYILVTHEFIDQESTLFTKNNYAVHSTPKTKNSPYSYGVSKVGSVNCGSEVWDSFVSKHNNFEMIFNGHYKAFEKTGPNPDDTKALWNELATSYRKDEYPGGRCVHQMMFNAQWAPKGGNGWIRILQFEPDGKTVEVKTYSPYLARTAEDKSKATRTTNDMQFSFKLPIRL